LRDIVPVEVAMVRRRIELFQRRHVFARLHRGDSDREVARGQFPRRTVGPTPIIVSAPGFDISSRVLHRLEAIDVRALVAQAAIEGSMGAFRSGFRLVREFRNCALSTSAPISASSSAGNMPLEFLPSRTWSSWTPLLPKPSPMTKRQTIRCAFCLKSRKQPRA